MITSPFIADVLPPASRRHLAGISPASRRHLAGISPASRGPTSHEVQSRVNINTLSLADGRRRESERCSSSELLDRLEQQGVVPVVIGLTRRGDDAEADRWIAAYNAVLRATAQARQIPFVDAWWAIDPLPDHGLGPDGLHLESYDDGPCIFTATGLQHGYNVRNLIQLEALARVEAALGGQRSDDDVLVPVIGDGSADQPWEIDVLPFIHDGDTADGAAAIDLYDCSSSDQSGPELAYALELGTDTALRVIVLDREGVDVDVHLLSGPGPESCIARDDSIVAGTFAAGSWRIVVDSWSDGVVDYPGRFVLAVVPCDTGDPTCAP